jgi:PIN domain nuclease of toxin-antitoxin system
VLLLDTHVLVRWIGDPDALSDPAERAIRTAIEAGETLHVSSISVWEIALLVAKGRLRLTVEVGEWIARTEALPFLTFLPVDNEIALRSVELPPPLHADPADRILAATAELRGLRLVTADRRLREYERIETVW